MKIVHVTPVYLPYHSGMTSVVVSQCTELQRRGHEVEAVTPLIKGTRKQDARYQQKTRSKEQDSNRIVVRQVRPALRYGNGAWVPHMFKYLKGYDVVHLHYPFFAGLEAVLLAKSLGYIKKLIVYYHFDHRVAGVFGPVARVYERVFLPLVLRAADTVMVSTMDYARNSRLKKYMSGKDFDKKVVEVPIGIDVEQFCTGERPYARTESLRQELGILETDKVVLFVGGMDRAHYFKGVDVLLKAFVAYISSDDSCDRKNRTKENEEMRSGGTGLERDVHLVLVGGGELRKRYEELAKDLGFSERVHFVGRVLDVQLPSYYALADVCVLPSTNGAEAFGVVLLEAQALGTPVLATDLPGVRSVVSESGLVVEVGDEESLREGLRSFFIDIEKWQGKSGEIVERVRKKYDMKIIGERIEAIYQS